MPIIPVKAFTVKYNGRANQLISETKVSQAVTPPQTKPSIPTKMFNAIWDTGAMRTVITSRVVEECGLKPIGRSRVITASGETETSVYIVNILLRNNVVVSGIQVNEGILSGNADLLIGMDIIGAGDFAVTNKDGKTTFSFRLPSANDIDFVKQKPPGAKKIGRNDPCPCGSGKKFKYCCGK